MVLALGIEAVFGWPAWLYARIGHPVTWIGALIARLDAAWNQDAWTGAARRRAGAATALLIIGIVVIIAVLIQAALPGGLLGLALTALVAAPLLAARSLHDHVAAVAAPLAKGDIAAARRHIAMIVGRDPDALDAAGIARAGLESLGENSSDGVVAPLFWGALLGLPGIAGYKAINTLDSMIGYRTPRHQDFGRFAARLDDVANWVPARLTAVGFALISGRPVAVLKTCQQDAPNHRSPNGGWPEAALAAALNRRVSGPRAYANRAEDHPWVNAGAPDPDAQDLRRGLTLYWRMLMLVAVVALLAGLGVWI